MISTVTWTGRALIPSWVLQFIVYILVIIFLALALTPDSKGASRGSALTLAELIFFVVCVLMVIGEIISFSRKTLNVWAYFSLQLFKSFFWTAILAITLVDLCSLTYIERKLLGGWATVMIVYLVITSLILYFTLAYACTQVHRHRKGKKLLNLKAGKQHSVV